MMVALLSQQSILASPDATPVDFTNALWLLVSSGLVFLMQPGFMCLESGLTRSKNSINVAVKNLADVGVSVGLYWAIGFGLMFGQTQIGWVGRTLFFWDAGSHPPSTVAFFVFQLMFCSTATTIVSGAVAERLRFAAYLATAVLVSGLIYPLFGCWAWNGVNVGENQGWLGNLGFVDFAGSTVVHSTGAWVSLAALLVIGSRSGRFLPQGEPRNIQGSNLPMAVLGAMLLWIGWIGFNGGSALEFNASVATIVLNTMVAGAAGMISAGLRSWLQSGQIQVEALINGSLAGLVAVTASCHAISSSHAFLVGALGSVAMYSVNRTLLFYKVDDAVEAIGVHGGAGVWGTLAFALFCKPEFLTPNLDRWQQVLVQLLGIGVCFAWAFGVTWLVLKGIDRIWPLRVSAEDEELGLNISEHGASTELYDLFQLLEQQAKTQDLSLRAPEQPFTEVGAIARRYNQVMDTLETKTQEMLDYIQQVEVLTVAASQVEADSFRPVTLDGVAQRLDSLGQLARVTIQGVTEECGFQALKILDWYGLSCFGLRSKG
ncbi:MAG: ammonium transporter, partial [Prochlorothrix sp.]